MHTLVIGPYFNTTHFKAQAVALHGLQAATDARIGFQHGHARTACFQSVHRRKTSQAGTDHDHIAGPWRRVQHARDQRQRGHA
ncbi:hypothetical protein D3C81_689340 [compost metagenome]